MTVAGGTTPGTRPSGAEPTAGLDLPARTVVRHLRIGLGRGEDPAADQDVLSIDERLRAVRFHHDDDRRRFVQTRMALRHLVGETLGLEPAAVAFTTVGRGRPVLSGPAAHSGLHVSASHTGDHGVVALAARPIGVDVELVRPQAWDLDLALRVLSPAELDYIAGAADRDLAFFRCWTRKEAFVKTGHDGLTDRLRALTLTPGPNPAGFVVTDRVLEAGVHLACAHALPA